MEGCEGCGHVHSTRGAYLKVMYWSADWEQLEHLSFDQATPMAVSLALGQWLEYRSMIGHDVANGGSIFSEVAAITVEVDRG